MKIAIFGASGRTGQHVAQQALGRCHEVVAFVRSAADAVTDTQAYCATQSNLITPVEVADKRFSKVVREASDRNHSIIVKTRRLDIERNWVEIRHIKQFGSISHKSEPTGVKVSLHLEIGSFRYSRFAQLLSLPSILHHFDEY